MLEQFSQLRKSSIFDEIPTKTTAKESRLNNYQLWETYVDFSDLIFLQEAYQSSTQSKYISTKILYQGVLIHQENAESMINLTVELYDDRMVAYLDEKKIQFWGVIGFDNGVKLEYTNLENNEEEDNKDDYDDEDDDIQFLYFSKQDLFSVLFCESPKEFSNWVNVLKPLCILSNFSQFYTFQKVIGKGTFAKVVLCTRNSDQQQFAVKVFDKSNMRKSKDSKLSILGLQNEINIMRQIKHPNIIQKHEVYEGHKHVYIVLELLTGGELFSKAQDEENFSESIICSLMQNLLQALEYLHAKKIMHRDIKPENIIIRNKDGSMSDIILADFGLSESIEKEEFIFKRCGTPGYVAPEILQNQPYDTQVDVFSAGVIMYILLTGQSAFFGKSYMEIMNKNKNCEINLNFQEIGCKISNYGQDLLELMLKRNPNERITVQKALQHPWFKDKSESLFTKIHHEAMQQLLQEQYQLIKTTKPLNMNASQNLIQNSPLISGQIASIQNSAMNSPDQSASPNFIISPLNGLEKKSKFANKQPQTQNQ